MSPARRNHRRRDWPRGLYEPRPDYYVWRHPDGTVHVLGRVPFAVARNEGGPSFHEIRSLAKRLYDAQGNVDTLALLGHADGRTGDIYANARDVAPELVRITA